MTHSGFALAHALVLPDGAPWGGLVILHGAGSHKETHADMARRGRAAGLAAVRSTCAATARAAARWTAARSRTSPTAAALLPPGLPIALRGSSMGGYLALVGARAGRRGRRRRDLPGASGAGCARGLAHRALRGSRPTRPRSRRSSPPPARRARSPGALDPGAAPARRGRRASCRWQAPARSRPSCAIRPHGWSCCPAATTARSSTTRAAGRAVRVARCAAAARGCWPTRVGPRGRHAARGLLAQRAASQAPPPTIIARRGPTAGA